MADGNSPLRLSAQEFLAWEEQQDTKYELVGGKVFAMSGAKNRHEKIKKNLIVFLLLITGAVTAYILLDDYFQANEDSLNSIQYGQAIIKTPLTNMPTSSGAISTGTVTTTSTISTFTANGTEPFWAADFSGATLARQSPDLGNITIS